MATMAAAPSDEEFKAWFTDGVMSTVLFTVLVFVLIAIVIKATG